MDTNCYEGAGWDTPDGVMRPGGLELTRRLLEMAALPEGARVLDIGCGRGGSTALLAGAGCEAAGLDRSAALLSEARRRYPELAFTEGDAAALPFADAAFDAVLLECVLSAVAGGAVLAECARVTGEAGLLLISDVCDLKDADGPLAPSRWAALLESAGFRCLRREDRTRDLKSFAAQLLWSTGSLDAPCGCMGCAMPAKPGYFAMIAEKGVTRK